MAYHFAVETEKENYIAINIKRCRRTLNNAFRYDEPFAYLLQEINDITTTYQNEEELKAALIKAYSLPKEHINKPLVIFYTEGEEKRLIKGKVLYEDSRDLIEDVSQVIKYIENKAKENDYIFFRQLAETLSDDQISKSLVSKVASFIEQRLVTEDREKESDDTNGLGSNIVTETAKLLVYYNHININESGMARHTSKVNYENLHNIVSFISDYEISLRKNKKSNLKKVLTNENTSNQ